MISKSVLKYLQSLPRDINGQLMPLNETPKEKSKFLMYMKRSHIKIDKELEGLNIICKNFPEIFLNQDSCSINSKNKKKPNQRVKELYKAIMILNPNLQLELTRKN